ncbi:hypothetical protein AgCh_015916 [Apium graveolens]
MSNRRRTGATRITDDELQELVLKLQALIPESSSRCTTRVSSSKILKETCNYIKKLHKEVDDLSTRLGHLLDSMDSNSVDVETLRSLLQRYSLP